MKRLLVILLATGALAACNKPTEENCRKALANMQRLMGTENQRDPELIEGEVRRCKGGSKKGAVDCAIKAQTFEELKHCNFYHLPDNALPDSLRGSGATGTTGSAAMGSAMTDTGSAAMSGSAAMTGSGAGSAAMTGSGAGSAAMTGSGAGSAAMTGSAAGSAATAGSAGSGAGSAAKAPKSGTPAKAGSAANAGSGAATK